VWRTTVERAEQVIAELEAKGFVRGADEDGRITLSKPDPTSRLEGGRRVLHVEIVDRP